MLDEEHFYKLATESRHGTPHIVNQDGNPNFRQVSKEPERLQNGA